MRSEKEMLELQLREKAEREHQQSMKAERDKRQPSAAASFITPLAMSQPSSQSRRSAPVAPAPSPSTSPSAASTGVAPMDTSEEGAASAPAGPADAKPALAVAVGPPPPLTSLIPFPPSEGQRLIEQLLLAPTEAGGGSLWTLLHSLNAFLAQQPSTSSSPIVASLASRMAELEGLITAVQEGKLSPPAFLSPCCHLLNSLCNISAVSADLSSLSLIPRPAPAADPAASTAPPKMRATDEIIAQLLHVFLILLSASPWCRLAAVKSPPPEASTALIVPSTHRPHPLAKLLNNPRLFVRQPAGRGRRTRESEDHAVTVAEHREDGPSVAAGEPGVVERDAAHPELVPLLLSIVRQQTQQRGQPRHYADAFLQPTLRLLLLLLQSSPLSLDLFLPLLSDEHLFPLLRLSTSPPTRCLAVQLLALCLEEPTTLRCFPHPISSPALNGRPHLSLLESLYHMFDEEDPLLDSRQQQLHPSRQRGREKPLHLTAESGPQRAQREVDELEARLLLRLHVLRLIAFVAERYGDDGIRCLVNERPDPGSTAVASAAPAGDEHKEQLQLQPAQPTVTVDSDRYSLIDLLVQLLTRELQRTNAAHASAPSPVSQPVVELHAVLWKDRRVEGELPASQPAVLWAWDASRTLARLRVQVVVEGFRVLCHLILASIPEPHALPPPMSLPSQLAPCMHALLALLTALSGSKEASIAALGREVAQLRAVLSAKKLLDTIDLYTA